MGNLVKLFFVLILLSSGEFFRYFWSVGCVAGVDIRSAFAENANLSGFTPRKASWTTVRLSLSSSAWKMFESK